MPWGNGRTKVRIRWFRWMVLIGVTIATVAMLRWSPTSMRGPLAQAGTPGNLIDNPGFESGLSGWSASGGSTLRRTRVSHSGDSATRIAVFPSRHDALARANVIVEPRLLQAAIDEAPAANTTYDLRHTTSTAYPDATLYAVNIGSQHPVSGVVTVGGSVMGQLNRHLTWQEVQDNFSGDALRVEASDWTATYDLRADNVQDGYNPRVGEGTQQDNNVPFLLEGSYMTYIRDDAVEDDDLMPGFIRDCLFDGVFVFLSAKPGDSDTFTNHGMVVHVKDVIVRLKPMPSIVSPDGLGHNKIFKWAYDTAGSVVVRDSIFYLKEVPEGSTSNMAFPDGTYRNVTVILGHDFDGDKDGNVRDLDYPLPLPRGVTVTRDVSIFTHARNHWLASHGFA
jgi:hypothetical protein